MSELPVVVVGAGAAGVMAAIFAAAGGRRVILLERTKDGGRKILISGGGRCNILPSQMDPAQYVTDSSPATLRNILRSSSNMISANPPAIMKMMQKGT
jgi:predicted flavoprotein YhiN